jgi:hypothetical protein
MGVRCRASPTSQGSKEHSRQIVVQPLNPQATRIDASLTRGVTSASGNRDFHLGIRYRSIPAEKLAARI